VRLALHWHDDLPSTQDEAHRLADAGAAAGTVVVARAQTRGRGTRDRVWSSEPGGLWMSVLARPRESGGPSHASVRAGLALAATLERAAALARGSIMLKWPNDLVARDRKLGGVLCETRWQGDRPVWTVAGVGLNVANPLPADLASHGIRLADLAPGCTDPAPLAEPLALAVLEAMERSGPLSADELSSFHARDWLRGRELLRPVAGRADGITPAGHLRVVRPDGTVSEVFEGVGWPDLAPSRPSR
jgi:BirA family biotin operon repressor/biotin-[acetyl-CoA-carboxylase] ligase